MPQTNKRKLYQRKSTRKKTLSKKDRIPSLKRRRIKLNFPNSISKHWLGKSAFRTHLLNSFTLIFPDGEKYFIRSTKKYLNKISNDALKKDAKAFMAQESQHYMQHEKFFENLRAQGYDIDKLLYITELIAYEILEPLMGQKINLATTAGLEHYTALLAEIGLEGNYLKQAQSQMRDLFEWHAAEEIEHKAVAYDVLQNFDDSYTLRIVGLIIATLILLSFSSLCTSSLLYQDKKLLDRGVWKDFLGFLFIKEKLFFKGVAIVLRYLKPNYHPWEKDNYNLAKRVFLRLQNKGLMKQIS